MLVAELVYSFLIPEVHKQEFRRRGKPASSMLGLHRALVTREYHYHKVAMLILIIVVVVVVIAYSQLGPSRRSTMSLTPCRMACLQRLAGTDPVSLRSYKVCAARARTARTMSPVPAK